MPTLYFIPSRGRFLAGRVTYIKHPSMDVLRGIVRIEPLAWVIA
jgi:hypothetical protein